MVRKMLCVFVIAMLVMGIGITSFAASSAESVPMLQPCGHTDGYGGLCSITSSELDACYNAAVDTLSLYYKGVDVGQKTAWPKSLSIGAAIKSYLNQKIEAERAYASTNDFLKTHHAMQYELISQECFAEKLILSIRVEINFNYMDLPEVQSSYSETTDAVFSFHANAWVLTDLYTRDDYYDAAVRGFADDYIALVSSGGLYLPTDIRARQMQALVNTQLKAFSEKTNFPVKNSKASLCNVEIPSSTLLAASPIALNKAAIVSYAKSNAKKNPPARGTSGVPYYDFSQISGAWDCTNFVSHALLAGGAPQYDPGTSGITSTTYWYYRSTSNRSSSWAGVNELYSFLTNGSTVKGPKGQSISYAPYSTPTFVAGDILQCYSSSYGGWRHSTIITGTYPISSSLTGALITGRSGGSSGDVDMKAADKYPNESKRVIKVFGYYN